MSERQSMLGDRVELRQKRQRQAVTCTALKDTLRALLGPAVEPDELDADAILDAAVSLHSELADLAVLDKKLSILNRELGN